VPVVLTGPGPGPKSKPKPAPVVKDTTKKPTKHMAGDKLSEAEIASLLRGPQGPPSGFVSREPSSLQGPEPEDDPFSKIKDSDSEDDDDAPEASGKPKGYVKGCSRVFGLFGCVPWLPTQLVCELSVWFAVVIAVCQPCAV
jgi:hypothetical protein